MKAQSLQSKFDISRNAFSSTCSGYIKRPLGWDKSCGAITGEKL